MMEKKTEDYIPGVEKAATGIEGFDQITGGGLPRGRTSLVIGSTGTGKTVFAVQTLVNGVRRYGEPGIFVAFEEPSAQIVENATFGWALADLDDDDIFFVDARLSPDTIRSGAFDLVGLLATVEEKVARMGAKRIALDSLDVMLRLIDDPGRRRQEVYRIHDWLSGSDLTVLITARLEGASGGQLAHAFLPFIADCVVQLSQRVEAGVALRSLRVVKYRGSGFSENEAPFVIGSSGMEVADAGPHKLDYEISEERVSTGVPGLDDMLRGGYFRGTSTVITGASGTAKTTLAGAFAEAASLQGERALFFSFDESSEEIVRNLRSVGIHLKPHVESGVLGMVGARADARSADEHLLRIRAAIEEQEPRYLIIDPISAITKGGGPASALSVARQLIYHTKQEGITVLCTSLLPEPDPDIEATPLGISTLADNWIHVSYRAQRGERNRALTIVKARGTGHSSQVRELILSGDGLSLRDVYTAGGEVLMGTLRWEKEQEMAAERLRMRAEIEQRRQALSLAEAEAEARKQALEQEIEARRMELAALQEQAAREERRASQRAAIRREPGDGDSQQGPADQLEPEP